MMTDPKVLLLLIMSVLSYPISVICGYDSNNQIYYFWDRILESRHPNPPIFIVAKMVIKRDDEIGKCQNDSWNKKYYSPHYSSAIHLSQPWEKE